MCDNMSKNNQLILASMHASTPLHSITQKDSVQVSVWFWHCFSCEHVIFCVFAPIKIVEMRKKIDEISLFWSDGDIVHLSATVPTALSSSQKFVYFEFKMSQQSVSTNGDAKASDAAFKRIKSSMERNGYFDAEPLDSTLQGITPYIYVL